MKPFRSFRRPLAATVFLLSAVPAHAQLGLPGLGLPPALGRAGLDGLTRPAERLLERGVPGDLRGLRLDAVNDLLRRHRNLVEPDPRGEPAVRGEVLASGITAAALRAARDGGFVLLREERFEELGESLVVLRAPGGMSTAAAVALLRTLDPGASVDFNHLYMGSGNSGGNGAATAPAGREVGTQEAAGSAQGTVGLIDSGVDSGHEVFADGQVERLGCGGKTHPAPHGTAVAALMVGSGERFAGAAPGLRLHAFDIYCDSPTGGSAERIVAALAWMARHRIGVVNISLVGPANAALGRAVAAAVERGHLLVAAVGNDGPAAPPLYPASYPGVVGVTGVDRQGRPLPEAGRGPQVMFAAPGSAMVSAAPGAPPYRQVRGTSFAAPIVAGLLARRYPQPDRQAAQAALAGLAREAVRPGTDDVGQATGQGIVGAALRVDPARMR